MRGKASIHAIVASCTGITPAYAGKSDFSVCGKICTRDHPRLCGEKQQTMKTATISQGSPPPMRGKVIGKHSAATTTQDHPRLCGEKVIPPPELPPVPGSPPPMRGKAAAGGLCRKV